MATLDAGYYNGYRDHRQLTLYLYSAQQNSIQTINDLK